jgi:hypothetical protein
MATFQCPKGHTSTDPDYCSECGTRIGQTTVASAVASTASAPAPSGGVEICPDCMTPRTPGARFCEVCRYEFDTGKPGTQAASAPAAQSGAAAAPATSGAAATSAVSGQASPVAATAATSAPLAGVTQRLNVVVIADPSLTDDEEEKKQCPVNEPELIFPLDLEENLVGRRSDAKKIYPEVDIRDPGVSHRHLKFVRQADGSFVVLELGSANGTTLNGNALKPGLPTPIAAGDELILGMWTRLRIRGR